jgi:hypothetical protein
MFCQQPPHLQRPNMRLTRIKKGGHPHVTNNNKSFKNLTFSHRHERSYPIWLPKTKKKDTSQKLTLLAKNRKIWKQVCLSRTFMMFFSDLCVKCCVIHTYSSDIIMRFKEQDIKKKNNFLRIESSKAKWLNTQSIRFELSLPIGGFYCISIISNCASLQMK